MSIGDEMWAWAAELFPICRSLTGDGVRRTLKFLSSKLEEKLTIQSVPTGTKAFDWTVPQEWNIRDGYVGDESGTRIIDFQKSNLHVLGYSEPIDEWLTREELDKHLYSLPDQPGAIPYVTSYYAQRWGFCLAHQQRLSLPAGRYHAVIDSELKPGELNYGELILPGNTNKEVLISTYICHPSMANNELSGPVVTTALARYLLSKERRYTYRFVFVPETIGSIVYLSRNLKWLQANVIAGFNVSCIGDERCYSYLPSRKGNTLADKVALHTLKHIDPDFRRYSWLDRGSDERQYCAPGVDLPVATIMRSKYGEYPEYHTSLDDLTLVTPAGLEGGFNALKQAIEAIECNCIPKLKVLCEPQLGRRGLYPTISSKGSANQVRTMMNLISFCDGDHSLLDIAELLGQPINLLSPVLEHLASAELVDMSTDITTKLR